MPTPGPGVCVNGASCSCSGASAGHCSQCGGSWCNGGHCSCGGSGGCSTQLTCSNFTATGPSGTVIHAISQDDHNKGYAVPELIVRPNDNIRFYNDIFPDEPYGMRGEYNWGDGTSCREWLVGNHSSPRAVYFCNAGKLNNAWYNDANLPNVTIAPKPYPWCDEDLWDSGDCDCTADGRTMMCLMHADDGVAYRRYAASGVYSVALRAQTACVWDDNNSNPCLLKIRVQAPPTIPTGLQVVCNNGSGNATFSWNASTNTARYVLRINKEPAADWANVAAGDQYIETSATSYTTNITFGDSYAWWSVQPVAVGEMYPYSSTAAYSGAFACPNVTPTPLPTLTPVPAQVGGNVFLDISNNCMKDSGEPGSSDATLRLERLLPGSCPAYSQNQNPTASGTYSFTNLNCFDAAASSTYRLRASTANANYELRCGNDLNLNVIGGANVQRDFGLTILRDPWFQAYSGAIYADGSIDSKIPASAINPRLVYSDIVHSPEVVSGGTINTNSGTVSSTNWKISSYASEAELPVSMTQIIKTLTGKVDRNNWNGAPPVASDATDGIAVYYNKADNVTLNGNWQNINFPAVVMVEGTSATNGNITIPNTIVGQRITLGANGFLMVLAYNDILVSSSIGEMFNMSSTPDLEGLFIAGRNVNVGGTNDRLVDKRINISGNVITGTRVAGTYISRRSHEDNHLYPSDYFIYNPKLILNIPRILSDPAYEWGEQLK
ncbi:hypothetical protein HGA91_05000 [candidate division WWE3 bacterium]|nr:hypothetical protein [candidate division WWE3 bacterium]